MALAVGLVLTSCSNDDLDNPGGTDPGNGQAVKGYLSMSIVNNTVKNGTRNLITDGGTDEENFVESAVVVLYDATTNIVAYQFHLTNMDPSGDDIYSKNDNVYVTEAEEVDKKAYKLAVFLNPSQDVIDATVVATKSLSDIQAVKSVSNVTSLTGPDYDNFLMANFAGLVNVAETDIKNTEADAEKTPVKVDVERAVAKVIVDVNPSMSTPTEFTATNIFWQIDVTNKSTYWMRKQTERLANGSGSGVTIPEIIGLDPALREYTYAESPYFDKTSAAYFDYQVSLGNSLSYTKPDPTGHYNYITSTADVKRGTVSNTDPTLTNAVYVTENTMIADEQWEDVTTSVVLKTTITPAGTALGGTLDNNNYFVYRSMVFSGAELADIYSENATIGNTGKSWADIVAENTALTGFQEFLQESATKTELGGAGGDYSSLPDASAKSGALSFFKDGLNYYNVPIRHFSDNLQPNNMEYGRYGVVRNNMYKLTLNSINNFGYVTIPDKKDPDDKESWVSVEFTILPWVVRSQGIDL